MRRSSLFRRIPLPFALSMTRPTTTPLGYGGGVGRAEGMPVTALGFGGIGCGEGRTAQGVLPQRNWFQVVGVHAVSNTAQVVENEAVRYWADADFVEQPMSTLRTSGVSNRGIPIRRGAPRPNPAVSSEIYLGDDPLKERAANILSSHSEPPIPGVMRQGVQAPLPPFIVPNGDIHV